MNSSPIIKELLIASFLMVGLSVSASGQTLNFSMDVQPELGIEVLQDLNFGTVITNSGTQRIRLGESRMGIFKIKALAAQSALLRVQKPDHLNSDDANNEDKIPVTIRAAYSSNPAEYTDILHFRENSLQVSLGRDDPSSLSPSWETGYVFIFGDIDVGAVSKGSYSGTLTLNVTYQ